MPVDKLVLLSEEIQPKLTRFALKKGKPRGGYAHFVDLQKSKFQLPVLLHCGGIYGGINKIEFTTVAKLDLRQTTDILKYICGSLHGLRIFRIDFAVDIQGISVWELASCCRVAHVQKSAFFRSRGGVSFYPHLSRERALLIYERLKRLRSRRDPLADSFRGINHLTRIEVQFRGKGVPVPEFSQIRRYADIDLLDGVTFLKARRLRKNLKPQQILAAERLQSMVREVGLQNASKKFSAAQWAYLNKKLFEPVSESDLPDVRFLMQESARDWLESRKRFPRLKVTNVATYFAK
jgi:hypothetical protein